MTGEKALTRGQKDAVEDGKPDKVACITTGTKRRDV
jgi:hypothetical protein